MYFMNYGRGDGRSTRHAIEALKTLYIILGGKDMDRDIQAQCIVDKYICDHKSMVNDPQDYQIYIVWKCKILQNWKYLISSTIEDGMYYEVTFDGDKNKWYFDAYKKVVNQELEGDF